MYNKIEALAEPSHVKKRKKMSGSVNREAMEKATTVRVDRPCAAHDTCSSDPPCPLALRVPILLSKSPVWLYIQRYSAVTGAINPCAKTIAMAPLHLLFHPVVVRPLPCLLYISSKARLHPEQKRPDITPPSAAYHGGRLGIRP
jgi:hypothetical protein